MFNTDGQYDLAQRRIGERISLPANEHEHLNKLLIECLSLQNRVTGQLRGNGSTVILLLSFDNKKIQHVLYHILAQISIAFRSNFIEYLKKLQKIRYFIDYGREMWYN